MQGPLLKSGQFRAGFQGVGGEPQILRHLQTLLCSLTPGVTGKSIHGPHSGKPPTHTHQPSCHYFINPQPPAMAKTPWARTGDPLMTHAALERAQVLLVMVT